MPCMCCFSLVDASSCQGTVPYHSQGLTERMIVFISKDGAAPQQLLVTKRTTVAAVQAMLRLPSDPGTACVWKIDDGTWALADAEARLIDIADDLRGSGSSPDVPLCVRSPPGLQPCRRCAAACPITCIHEAPHRRMTARTPANAKRSCMPRARDPARG